MGKMKDKYLKQQEEKTAAFHRFEKYHPEYNMYEYDPQFLEDFGEYMFNQGVLHGARVAWKRN
jgi:hypothetical protein